MRRIRPHRPGPSATKKARHARSICPSSICVSVGPAVHSKHQPWHGADTLAAKGLICSYTRTRRSSCTASRASSSSRRVRPKPKWTSHCDESAALAASEGGEGTSHFDGRVRVGTARVAARPMGAHLAACEILGRGPKLFARLARGSAHLNRKASQRPPARREARRPTAVAAAA